MDDEDLQAALAAARDRDERAFAVLWRSLQPALLRYLRVVVCDAAQDVASETWLQVARDLRAYRGDAAGFRVWLFRIARNRALDEIRRAGRRREELPGVDRDGWQADGWRSASWPAEGGQPPGRPDHAEDAARVALDRLGTDWALALIAALPRDQAEAVMLRVVAGLDVKQAAAVLGKRPGAVRIAAMRGLRRLADNSEVQARHVEYVRRPGMVGLPQSEGV